VLLNVGVILLPEIAIPLKVEVFDEWEEYDPPFGRSAQASHQSIEVFLFSSFAELLKVFLPDGILRCEDVVLIRKPVSSEAMPEKWHGFDRHWLL
jgi:hypothetical protein